MTRVSELYYEEIGEDFSAFMSPYDVERRLALMEPMLPRSSLASNCLEVGCGTGEVSRWLLPRVGKLTVSDISAVLAESVAEQLHCEAVATDACQLDLADESFDLVVSSECIEHTPDPRGAIREMVRVLKPGGALVLTTPNKIWYPVLLLAQKLGLRKFQGNEIWLFPATARRLLCEAGCEVLALGGCHLFPWQLPGSRWFLRWFDRAGGLLYPVMINFGIAARKRS